MTRIAIWRWLTRGLLDGQILPQWLIAFQAALFPRRTLLWFLQRNCGFDPLTCYWTIHGVRFSDSLFMAFAQPRPNAAYRFERKPGSSLVTIHELPLSATWHTFESDSCRS